MALKGSTILMQLVAVSKMSRAPLLTLEGHNNSCWRCPRAAFAMAQETARERSKSGLTTMANEVHGGAGRRNEQRRRCRSAVNKARGPTTFSGGDT